MWSIGSIEIYAYQTNKDAVSEKEKIKCNNIREPCKKMFNFDDVIKKTKENNPNWPQMPGDPYKTSIIR